MNGSAVIFEVVLNRDFDPVTPARLDPWSWVLIVVDFTAISSFNAVSIDGVVRDVEIVLIAVSES